MQLRSLEAPSRTVNTAHRCRNPLFVKAISDADFMSNPDSCHASGPRRRLLEAEDFDVENFGRVAGMWVLGSAGLALLGGLLLLHLFRKIPQTMVILGFTLPVRPPPPHLERFRCD